MHKKDYNTTGDFKSSTDLLIFLVNWLERFPEYKNRDLYIAGEGYAGHLAPRLADYIQKHNQSVKNKMLNLIGFMMGNPEFSWDWSGNFEFFWGHALISDEAWQQIKTHCYFMPTLNQSAICDKATDEMEPSLNRRYINFDSIYAPLCRSDRLTPKPKRASVLRFDPCSDKYVINYMNLPQVHEALHADVTNVYNNSWYACSRQIPFWYDRPDSMKPLIQKLMATGIRIWVYHGDTDGRYPITSTKAFINDFKLPVKSPWKPWYFSDEIGGYTVVYKGDLVLATVRGAGQPVPGYQPRGALVLAKSFIQGKPLPDKN